MYKEGSDKPIGPPPLPTEYFEKACAVRGKGRTHGRQLHAPRRIGNGCTDFGSDLFKGESCASQICCTSCITIPRICRERFAAGGWRSQNAFANLHEAQDISKSQRRRTSHHPSQSLCLCGQLRESINQGRQPIKGGKGKGMWQPG